MFACYTCGDDIDLSKPHEVCAECGAFACTTACLNDHECDPEGDMDDEED